MRKRQWQKLERERDRKVFIRITFIIGALLVHLTFIYIITLSLSIAACAITITIIINIVVSFKILMYIYIEFMNLINIFLKREMVMVMRHYHMYNAINAKSKKEEKSLTEQTGKDHDETCTQVYVNRFNV